MKSPPLDLGENLARPVPKGAHWPAFDFAPQIGMPRTVRVRLPNKKTVTRSRPNRRYRGRKSLCGFETEAHCHPPLAIYERRDSEISRRSQESNVSCANALAAAMARVPRDRRCRSDLNRHQMRHLMMACA